ncbi:hypothetical protein DNTS_025351 [Danionella cerebrum]|uniref:Uncharacterized protein n=1 Tax=Danionella cerebrum TaxID=2873325 RepID=A0A553NME9_9TELE|nr:hypothetical protein DNTS_025351 [Danionella translucida]
MEGKVSVSNEEVLSRAPDGMSPCLAYSKELSLNISTMKDFVLSLLSRGYGQRVPNADGHEGRLEVCFEPEDYFNWKSQHPLLNLTSSGRFFGGMESVPPKTFSTRRGPLILYSEDLASTYQSGLANRKRKAPSCSKQDAEKQLNMLQDLTGAIPAFGKKKLCLKFLLKATEPESWDVNLSDRPVPSKSSRSLLPIEVETQVQVRVTDSTAVGLLYQA